MREENKKIYNVEELEQVAPAFYEKMIEKAKNAIIDDNFWFFERGGLEQFASDIFGLEKAKFAYSLSYSQGDGLSFGCDDLLQNCFYIYKAVKKELTGPEKTMLKKLEREGLRFYAAEPGGHYCYASKNDCGVDFEKWEFSQTTEKQTKLIDKVLEIVKNCYIEICKKLEEIGYNNYDATEEQAKQFLIDNDTEFCEVGPGYFVQI